MAIAAAATGLAALLFALFASAGEIRGAVRLGPVEVAAHWRAGAPVQVGFGVTPALGLRLEAQR